MAMVKGCPNCGCTGMFTTFHGEKTKCVICRGRGVVNEARYEAVIDYWHARALPDAEDPISEAVRDRKLTELSDWWAGTGTESGKYQTALGAAFDSALNLLRRAA